MIRAQSSSNHQGLTPGRKKNIGFKISLMKEMNLEPHMLGPRFQEYVYKAQVALQNVGIKKSEELPTILKSRRFSKLKPVQDFKKLGETNDQKCRRWFTNLMITFEPLLSFSKPFFMGIFITKSTNFINISMNAPLAHTRRWRHEFVAPLQDNNQRVSTCIQDGVEYSPVTWMSTWVGFIMSGKRAPVKGITAYCQLERICRLIASERCGGWHMIIRKIIFSIHTSHMTGLQMQLMAWIVSQIWRE